MSRCVSRHRDEVHLHYGRDDFANAQRLVRTLSRDRPKDSALDYDQSAVRFAERRRFDRSKILAALAREQLVDRSHTAPEQPRAAGSTDCGCGPRMPSRRRGASRFDGLKLSTPTERAPVERQSALGSAVQRYARAVQDIGRMTEQGLPALEYQKAAKVQAAQGARRGAPGMARTISMRRSPASPA